MLANTTDILNINPSEIHPVPDSYSSEVYRLTLEDGEDVVLKIPFNKIKVSREYRMLTRLKGKLPVPEVLGYWEGDGEITGALLLSFIDGLPLSGEISDDMAYKMGKLLGRLHSLRAEGYGDGIGESAEPEWWQGIKDRFTEWVEDCRKIMPESELRQCINLFESIFTNLPPPDGPCVVHFDYRPGNILVRGSEIAGLIDFESARGGSADIDFVKIKIYVWDLFPSSKEMFIRGYGDVRKVPDLEITLPFYEFYNAFGGVAWCVRREQTHTPFLEENMVRLQRMLKDSA
jgi:Ser/Thr protein kinase RdoA (MazF antagonist)